MKKSGKHKPPVVAPMSSREPTKQRRHFIIEMAKETGEVTDAQIAAEAGRRGVKWGLSAQSLKDDAAYFKKKNIPIMRPARKSMFLFYRDVTSPYELRKEEMTSEKEAIGQLAADLIRGATVRAGGVKYTRQHILASLKEYERDVAREKVARGVARKLKAIYEKHDRFCALDSGTTTLKAAGIFEQHGRDMLPDLSSPLKSLTMLTNSTDIAVCLAKSSIQVVMLGGRLRKETHAFAGSLAKGCLDAWNIHLDVSIVGTVGLKVRKQFLGTSDEQEFLAFMSDTFEECETKQALFARSTLRVVLMDSSKFKFAVETPVTVGHFPFAGVSANDVDILITDNGLSEGDIEACWKEGVAVLVADRNKV